MSERKFISCSDCACFFEAKRDKPPESIEVSPLGVCRRYPPKAQLTGGQNPITQQPMLNTVSIWPPVKRSEGCGEGEPKPPMIQ